MTPPLTIQWCIAPEQLLFSLASLQVYPADFFPRALLFACGRPRAHGHVIMGASGFWQYVGRLRMDDCGLFISALNRLVSGFLLPAVQRHDTISP